MGRVVLVCVLICMGALAQLKKPTVLVAIMARNKAHTLPYYLTALENLDYPKERISLWIRSDHNSDGTVGILREWVDSIKDQYHLITTDIVEKEEIFPEELGPADWTKERFLHVINLRESALNFARTIWADYFFTIDCDVFLTNPQTLNILISQNLPIVAPMLKSDGLYSNFWHGITEDYYYQRTEDYQPVLNREKTGCFNVPMVHSCVLVDLRHPESDLLTYNPAKVPNFQGPTDDIIAFAISANRSDLTLNLCNQDQFGYVIVPLEQSDKLDFDLEQLTNIKLEVLMEEEPLSVSGLLSKYTSSPPKDTLGFDRIFMINLARRPERRKRMMACFQELGLEVTVLEAVDGRALNASVLEEISFLPEYADPYHHRPMTLGEIGCFLSHYNIWQEMVTKGYKSALILEDDIRYFGRKRMQESEERRVEGSSFLVEAGYSYWTLGYVLSLEGSRKLLDAEPLSRLVPVDEYLPILFDKHPQDSWKDSFRRRDVVALSAAPLLVYPTHYTGEHGYISDTEDSLIIKGAVREDL